MGTARKRFDITDFSLMFGCGFSLIIECLTLVRVLKGSKHRFVITILVMLIGANLAYIANEFVFIDMLKTNDYSDDKLEICFGFLATGLLLFNVSHWMFAYKYFKMSRQIPFKISKRKIPRNIVVCD